MPQISGFLAVSGIQTGLPLGTFNCVLSTPLNAALSSIQFLYYDSIFNGTFFGIRYSGLPTYIAKFPSPAPSFTQYTFPLCALYIYY